MTDVTGSVSTMDGASGQSFNPNDDAKNTPRSFDVGQDARSMNGGGQYPNYWSHKTRSGHNFIMDDSEGNESVTLQHRSGSSLQFRPDGGVLMTTHNGKYEVVFGENRVTISGAHDITVKGDASMRIYGNNNTTVHGDHNMTIMGDHNITAKNINYSVRGNIDTEAKNINTRVEGSGTYNYQGALSTVSKGNMTHLSTGGKVYHGAKSGHHTHVDKGDITKKIEKQGNFGVYVNDGEAQIEQKSGGGTSSLQRGKMGVGAGGKKSSIRMKDGSIHSKTSESYNVDVGADKNVVVQQNLNMKSTSGKITGVAQSGNVQFKGQDIVHQATANYQATAGSSMDMRAPSGQATFAGMQTAVNALGGVLNLVGQGGGINVDSLGGLLNLNGAIGTITSALGLQLSFNFGDILDSLDMPDIGGGQAEQPEEEPDLSSEINSWL